MKDNHSKNYKLIKELSELMTKQKITSLEYKFSDIKLKIRKYENTNFKIETQQLDNNVDLPSNQCLLTSRKR